MALFDYKFWYIQRSDDGFIEKAAIRVYQGDITTENEEIDIHRNLGPVTRYRRAQRIPELVLRRFSDRIEYDSVGNPAFVLNNSDFGAIRTDAELCAFINTLVVSRDATKRFISNL